VLAESIAGHFEDWLPEQEWEGEVTLHQALQYWLDYVGAGGAADITGGNYALFMQVVAVTLIQWMEDHKRYTYTLRRGGKVIREAHVKRFSNDEDEAGQWLGFMEPDRFRDRVNGYQERRQEQLALVAGGHPVDEAWYHVGARRS
jgi:hypothetical protein